MKLKTIILILGAIIVFILLSRACISHIKKELTPLSFKENKGEKKFSFKETDFTTGEYAILLDDKEPPILIDDAAILEANKGKIETDVSWLSYLPAEGGVYGLRVFKNRQLVEARLARKFNIFKVGKLREYGKPVEFKYIFEPRSAYDKQKDSLENREDVFISRATAVSPEGYEYRFVLKCPSILVPEQDSTFNETTYGIAFAQRIESILSDFSGFKMGTNASNRIETNPYIVLKKDGATQYLRDSETNNTLTLKGYTLHGAQLIFFCTKAFYEKLQTVDFSSTFKREGLSEEKIKTLLRKKIGPDTKDMYLEAVYNSMFTSGFEIGSLMEQKYELRYFQLLDSEETMLP